MAAFGAHGLRHAMADGAGRTHVPRQTRVQPPDLLQLFHRGRINFLLRVETRPHRPLMQQVQQRPAFHQPDGGGVRQHVDGKPRGDTHPDQAILRRPGVFHRLTIKRLHVGVPADQHRRQVVGLRGAGGGEQRARSRHHAVPLVLRIGRVA